MNKLYLLDCTLRDGGFMNDWRFGNYTIRSVVTRLDRAGIDIIECGFLDSRSEYDRDRTLFPDFPSVARTLSNAVPKRAMLVAMIDFGTFDRKLLLPKNETVLDGIRLIFRKENIDEALEYGRELKRLGFKLFLNPVAITSYRDIELLTLIEKINAVDPFGISIVDTYGVMFDETVEKCITLIHANLHPDIVLGYHSHFNLRMSDALCLRFINKHLLRDISVDVTILGMGKNAGNAATETVAAILDKTGLKKYDMNQIFECAYTDISKFYVQSTWGYSLDNVLTAIHDCSPNWTKFLMNKNTLSIKDIRTILDSLPYEKREVSYFTKEIAEQKYLDYMDKHVEDSDARASLRDALSGNVILLLCPGSSLNTHKDEIKRFIAENNPRIITVNFISSNYSADYAFISNANRYSQMLGIAHDTINLPLVLLTSNIVQTDVLPASGVFNYKTLYEYANGDNSSALLLSLLKNIGIGKVAIAGMDGFDPSSTDNSYFDIDMGLAVNDTANDALTSQLQRVLTSELTVDWITPPPMGKAILAPLTM